MSLPNHVGRALTESDTMDALRRKEGRHAVIELSAFNLIVLLKLLLVGSLPLTMFSYPLRDDPSVTEEIQLLSLSVFSVTSSLHLLLYVQSS